MTDEWTGPFAMKALDDDLLSFTNFSLDMTYFEHKGEHFVIWAQILKDSSLMMAKINPQQPDKLISLPIVLSTPEYDWEKVKHKVNEGASILKTEDKIYVFFSASGTGAEYCIGRLEADINADIMNTDVWKKLPHPVLTTENLINEAGPGHNSFVRDENNSLLLVYHARPSSHAQKLCGSFCEESLYDPCRHTRIKKVMFDKNNEPHLY